MNWESEIHSDDEKKVFRALDGEQFTWRTIGGIARDADLSEDAVAGILNKYNKRFTRFSKVPSASGKPLVGLIEKVG